MSYLRLFFIFFKVGMLTELEYRVNFFVQLFQSLLNLAGALIGVAVLFSHTAKLGDWTAPQICVLLGIFLLVGGGIGMVLRPSMQKLMEDVRRGTFDFTLTKPEDAQVLASVRQIEIWKVLDVILGLVVMTIGLQRAGVTPTAWQCAGFLLALLAGAAIVYSFCLILATLTFWFVRMENVLVIFESMYDAARWPLSLYPPWMRGVLTFLVPVAFAVTVPAEALVGRLNGSSLLTAVGVAAALLLISRWFWKIGVRQYSGASA